MPDTYRTAWDILRGKIAKSRRQSISKADLMQWQLEALERAVNWTAMDVVADPGAYRGEQEKA